MAGTTDGRNGFPASALNVTTLVLIFVVVIFAVVTQFLVASGAVSLSTTLQLTMWLVALGFIVLLAIAYMFFRVFERVYEAVMRLQKDRPRNAGTIQEPPPAPSANGQQDPTDGGGAPEAEDAWVPPYEHRHLDGSECSVTTEEVFPDGCYLVPGSIRPVPDGPTGQQVYECRVVDRNRALKDRAHETVVNILADREPVPPGRQPFELVEFDGLTITPYVSDRNPMRISYSLRATGLHLAAAPTGRQQATWTVPPRGVL